MQDVLFHRWNNIWIERPEWISINTGLISLSLDAACVLKERGQDQQIKKKRRNSRVSTLSIGVNFIIEDLIAKKNEDKIAKRIPFFRWSRCIYFPLNHAPYPEEHPQSQVDFTFGFKIVKPNFISPVKFSSIKPSSKSMREPRSLFTLKSGTEISIP